MVGRVRADFVAEPVRERAGAAIQQDGDVDSAGDMVLAGVFAEIVSAARTVTSVAGRPPIVTAAPAAKPDPRIVNSVPPAAGPVPGVTD